MKSTTLLVFLILSVTVSAHDTLLKQLAFGKGKTVVYGGSGRAARYKDFRFSNSDNYHPGGTPLIVFGMDHCFYPHASNAYLGIGPYISYWSKLKPERNSNSINPENKKSVVVTALKLSHHCTYFVKKRLDVSTGYLLGTRLQFNNAPKNEEVKKGKNENIQLVFGISVTLRYYFIKNLGAYFEAGIGHNMSMPNIGLCYKFDQKN